MKEKKIDHVNYEWLSNNDFFVQRTFALKQKQQQTTKMVNLTLNEIRNQRNHSTNTTEPRESFFERVALK